MHSFIHFVVCFFISLVSSLPEPERVVVTGPGVSSHGKENLVCFPTTATNILTFFFVNYVAHATTVRLPPGMGERKKAIAMSTSLLYPVKGIGLALDAIFRWSWKLKRTFPYLTPPSDSLETAQKAGALVMAIRSRSWTPTPSDTVLRNLSFRTFDRNFRRVDVPMNEGTQGHRVGETTPKIHAYMLIANQPHSHGEPRQNMAKYMQRVQGADPEALGINSFNIVDEAAHNIHGGFKLPNGYDWVKVPRDFVVRPYGGTEVDGHLDEIQLGSSYSLAQPVIAIVQAVSAGITLYKTRGDQLERYGFAAFGLTVTPYLLMSIVNFIAQIALPSYGKLYPIRSEILDEALSRSGKTEIAGVVGELVPVPSLDSPHGYFDARIREGVIQEAVIREAVLPPPLMDGETVTFWSNPGHVIVEPTLIENRTAANLPTEPILMDVKRPIYTLPDIRNRKFRHHDEGDVYYTRIAIPFMPPVKTHTSHPPLKTGFKTLMPSAEVWKPIIATLLALIALAVIGILSSGFQPGSQSTLFHRVTVICWLVCSIGLHVQDLARELVLKTTLPILNKVYSGLLTFDMGHSRINVLHVAGDVAVWFFQHVFSVAVLIMLFVMVGKELVEYGDCTYFDKGLG